MPQAPSPPSTAPPGHDGIRAGRTAYSLPMRVLAAWRVRSIHATALRPFVRVGEAEGLVFTPTASLDRE